VSGVEWAVGEWWKAVILGIVEGLTEFLPISSTGHLLIVSDLLAFQQSIGGTFEIFIQFGAVLAVVAYYARDLLTQARSVTHDPGVRRFWACIVIAFLPAAVLGLLLRNWIKAVLFASPSVIAWSLILGGIVLIVAERLPRRRAVTSSPTAITFGQAIVVGLAQATALIPGVSRSGASMVGGLLTGLDRPTATAFSFYLAIPTLGAATVVDLVSSLRELNGDNLPLLLIGTVVSGVVAGASIRWLLGYVAHHTFVPFGIYRVAVGLLLLGLIAAGAL
jgi:undecaprenyl-diphosphatase